MVNRARRTAKEGVRNGGCLPSSLEAPRFNFDELAKEVARGLSRREALRLAFTGVAGAVLTGLGIKTAQAATGDCNGQQNYPILNLAACPNRVQIKPPSTDGICTGSPWQGFGSTVDFKCCCVQHDYCFTTCGSSFDTCNSTLYNCLVNQCQRGGLSPTDLQQCKGIALLMYLGVSTRYPGVFSFLPSSGYSDYVDDQSTYCACCSCLDGQTVCGSGDMCSCDASGSGCSCFACNTCVASVQFCASSG
jgi:hypothetical protein